MDANIIYKKDFLQFFCYLQIYNTIFTQNFGGHSVIYSQQLNKMLLQKLCFCNQYYGCTNLRRAEPLSMHVTDDTLFCHPQY